MKRRNFMKGALIGAGLLATSAKAFAADATVNDDAEVKPMLTNYNGWLIDMDDKVAMKTKDLQMLQDKAQAKNSEIQSLNKEIESQLSN